MLLLYAGCYCRFMLIAHLGDRYPENIVQSPQTNSKLPHFLSPSTLRNYSLLPIPAPRSTDSFPPVFPGGRLGAFRPLRRCLQSGHSASPRDGFPCHPAVHWCAGGYLGGSYPGGR